MRQDCSNLDSIWQTPANYVLHLLCPEEVEHPEAVIEKFCGDNYLDRM